MTTSQNESSGLPDSGKLMNDFIDTHPDFMKQWPLKHRMAFRNLCDEGKIKEFFDNFIAWDREIQKKLQG